MLLILFSNSCQVTEQSPLTTFSSTYGKIRAGDLVVTNSSSGSAILLDKDGNYKDIIYSVDNNSNDTIYGVAWDTTHKKVVLSVSGDTDRVVSVDPLEGSTTEVIVHTSLSSNTLYDLELDSSGNFYILENTTIEKFDSSYQRVIDGTFPVTLAIRYFSQISIVPNIGFVLCTWSDNVVETYDTSFNVIETETSPVASTSDPTGCVSDSDSNIYVAWSGTNDTIIKYNSDFSTQIATYNDIAILGEPGGMAFKSNGNLLVLDTYYHYIVELDSNLNYVRTLGGGVLNSPWHVLEVPFY